MDERFTSLRSRQATRRAAIASSSKMAMPPARTSADQAAHGPRDWEATPRAPAWMTHAASDGEASAAEGPNQQAHGHGYEHAYYDQQAYEENVYGETWAGGAAAQDSASVANAGSYYYEEGYYHPEQNDYSSEAGASTFDDSRSESHAPSASAAAVGASASASASWSFAKGKQRWQGHADNYHHVQTAPGSGGAHYPAYHSGRSSLGSGRHPSSNNNENDRDDASTVVGASSAEAFVYEQHHGASSYYGNHGEAAYGYEDGSNYPLSSSISTYSGDYYEEKAASSELDYSGYESASVYSDSRASYSGRGAYRRPPPPPPPPMSQHPLYYEAPLDASYYEYAGQHDAYSQRSSTQQQQELRQVHSQVPNIFSLTRHNRYEDVEELFDAGLPVDTRDRQGNTVLCIACQNGLKRIAKLALRRGANINTQNYRGNSPLHFCYMFRYGDTLGAYLLSKGADPTLVNSEGRVCYEMC